MVIIPLLRTTSLASQCTKKPHKTISHSVLTQKKKTCVKIPFSTISPTPSQETNNNRLHKLDHKDWLSPNDILKIFKHLLCKSVNLSAAFYVLEEFPKQRCRPNVRTFSTLMHGLCEGGMVEEAFGLFDRMERDGIDPDMITFNIVISGFRSVDIYMLQSLFILCFDDYKTPDMCV
ncbi:PPR_2 domain-containing protein [Cephalotus follicularis]|uniref:PPR_2 domain-containing protein n=1 Tax=Cephalotus follicularis TaxID=3775 RepID=A0A1Q3CW90_CEPFO|nr:PPR_2 domain-containing protein [Cephalotus follicularis]